MNEFYSYTGHDIESYERSHGARLDFLVEDLCLDKIQNNIIGDFGCGYGQIFRRLPRDQGNVFYGFDSAKIENADFVYFQVDLNRPFTQLVKCPDLDIAFSFETLEHLSDPYTFLLEVKKILKLNHILFLSIPHESCTHNTFYPGLIYPVHNFEVFLHQMAFEILDKKIHRKAFAQNVYKLKNKDWHHSTMLFPKSEEKFRNIPPHVAINL